MSSFTTSYPSNTSNAKAEYAQAAIIFIVTALLSFAPLVILGSAIGWPASLGNPAADQLVAVGRAPQAVSDALLLGLVFSRKKGDLMLRTQ